MTFRFLNESDFDEILNTFNESFKNYFISTKLDKKSLEQKIKEQNIDYEYSIGAFENNKLIGFILHSKFTENNCNCLYNAGTGVLPLYRGKKLTFQMYEFAESKFSSHEHSDHLQISKVYLEVISENIPAQKAYSKIGFTEIRKLNCYKQNSNALEVLDSQYDFSSVELIQLKDLSLDDFTILKSKFLNRPAYQNSFHVLANLVDDLICLKFLENYLIGNSKNGRIYIIQSDDEQSLELLFSKFVNSVTTNFNIEKTISFINIDSADLLVNSFLEKKKFEKFITQKELCKVIEFF